MEVKYRTIVCFTHAYPYGKKETYFEEELNHLAGHFDRVYIQPISRPSASNEHRAVPSNVVVRKPVVKLGLGKVLPGIFNLSPVNIFIKDFFKHKTYLSLPRIRAWFNDFLVYRIVCRKFKPFFRKLEKDSLLYSYWADAYFFLSEEASMFKKIIRMHRGDFYLDVNNGYLPCRREIYSRVDLFLPISDDISRILQNFYKVDRNKIFLSRLGVIGHRAKINEMTDDVVRIVSCSRVDPIKRVDLIAETIFGWEGGGLLEWHHFGDGQMFEDLGNFCRRSESKQIKVVLHGWVDPNELFTFYENNYVSWFINLSLHEGIPVSIMEAISFGIPVIATDVGATREIVDESNGFLISVDLKAAQIIELISIFDTDEYRLKRRNALNTWADKYDIDKNSEHMINKIHSVFNRNSFSE